MATENLEVKALKDEFLGLVTTLRAENEAALKKDRALDEEFKTRIITDQKAIIDKLAELQKPQLQAFEKGDAKKFSSPECKSFFNYMRGVEYDKKALVSDATGRILLPEELDAAIREGLPQLNVIRQLCSVRTVNKDRVRIRYSTKPVVAWGKLETGTSVTNTTLVPSEAIHYVEDLNGLVQIGVDELNDTDLNLAQYITNQFLIAFADEEEAAFAVGRGHTTYGEPAGIFSTAGGVTTKDTAAAGAVTFADLKGLVYDLPAQYRPGASFLMHSGTELLIQLLRAEVASGYYGDYYWQPSLIQGRPNTLLGYPIYNCDDIAQVGDGTLQKVVAFGNYKIGYEIIDREGASLQRLNELYITSGLIGFLATRRLTGGVVVADAIRILVEHA